MVAFIVFILQLACMATIASSANLKSLVVFGDSNSDLGNSQRLSNGPLWSEYLAAGWNVSLYSFAHSGSVCDTGIYNTIAKEDRAPSLRDQVEAFYNLNLNLKPEETVYAFWFGVQDVSEMSKRRGRQEPDYKKIADCIGQQLRSSRKVFLSDKYLVFNVPPLGQMPYYHQPQDGKTAAKKNQAAVDVNRALEKEVDNLNKHHHALEMDYVDIHSLISDMSVDPAVFGFENTNDSYVDTCFENEQCKLLNEKDYIWWDKTHFTTAFHRTIANSIIEAESFAPKVTLTIDQVFKLRSESYTVPSYTGIVDEKVKQFDNERSRPIQPVQPPLDDDMADFETRGGNGLAHIALLIFALVIAGIIIYIKFPHLSLFAWIRNVRIGGGSRKRGNFAPVRNKEEAA